MHPVAVVAKSLREYARVVGDEKLEEIRRLAEPLRGARVLHVNATAYGGGVAEILHNLVPLMNDIGLEALWYVLEADDPAFFDVTKRIHNALQGMPLDLSDQMRDLFLATDLANVAQLPEVDLVIAHDPQAVALRHFAAAGGGAWAWRCHIDLTDAYTPVWSWLRPFVQEHDAAIFTMPQFAKPDLAMDRIVFSAPSIDVFSEKNGPLPSDEVRRIVSAFGFDPARPLLVQVSRFDPWKDPNGVIDAYRRVKADVPDVQLAMIGSLADDDPEGKEFLARSVAHAGDDPDVRCLTNLDGVRDREVNAFQRAASVVIQKSLREGFGLVVAEALWKGIPVVGGAVGGIPLQIVDGETGFLVRTADECAERCLQLLRDPGLRDRMGAAGHERVRDEFLITRDLRDHLRLFAQLQAEASNDRATAMRSKAGSQAYR
jgi:trehalose synthase